MTTYEKRSTLTPTHHQTRVRERAFRPQSPHAEKDALTEQVGVVSHLRNALGLILVGGGVVGIMSLFCGSFVR